MKLTLFFFENKTTLEIAKQLIGKLLVLETPNGTLKGIINETEAYTQEDESSHSYKGKITKRNKTMFEKPGHLYVYFTYGMYYCCNIVTGKKNIGEAVLIRSIIPIEGIEIMKKNRKKDTIKNLTNGPAKLCQAYKIEKEFNNLNLLNPNSKLYLEDNSIIVKNIQNSTRIGITKAKNLKWRFFSKDF